MAEESTTPVEGADVETEQEDPLAWVPEKFRSNPEELVKSYQEAERRLHEKSQEAADARKQYEELLVQQQTQTQQQAQPGLEEIYQAYETDPVGTMRYLAQLAAQEAVQAERQHFQQTTQPIAEQQSNLLAYAADRIVSERVPDWREYQPQVAEEIQKNPDLVAPFLGSPEQAAAALERVYKSVKFDTLQNQTQTLAEQAAEAQRQTKLAAQTLSGAAGNPPPQDGDADYVKRIFDAPSTRYR